MIEFIRGRLLVPAYVRLARNQNRGNFEPWGAFINCCRAESPTGNGLSKGNERAIASTVEMAWTSQGCSFGTLSIINESWWYSEFCKAEKRSCPRSGTGEITTGLRSSAGCWRSCERLRPAPHHWRRGSIPRHQFPQLAACDWCRHPSRM